jgi:hypothetical protein
MTIDDISAILTGIAIAATVVSFLTGVQTRLAAKREALRREGEPQTLDARLRALASASGEVSRLAKEVEVEAEAQLLLAKTATEEARRSQALASLNQEQSEAVSQLVRQGMADEGKLGRRVDFWKSLAVNSGFFILGILASVVVTLYVRPLWN